MPAKNHIKFRSRLFIYNSKIYYSLIYQIDTEFYLANPRNPSNSLYLFKWLARLVQNAVANIVFNRFAQSKNTRKQIMSFNEFTLPALPQTAAPGLNGTDNNGSSDLKSCRHNESADKGQRFLDTLNQISDKKYDRSRESSGAENTAGISDNSDCGSIVPQKMNKSNDNPHADLEDTGASDKKYDRSRESSGAENTAGISDNSDCGSIVPQKMNKSNDNPHADLEDTGASESAQTAACTHPSQALGLLHEQFFNFLISANGSFSAANHPDSTTAPRYSLLANLIAQLQPEGQAVSNGQVGIGLFEQLQANNSPDANNLYFFEQLAGGALNHQNGDTALGITTQFWGLGNWMATLSAGNLSPQTEVLGPHANPALTHLLHMQGVNSPVLGLNAEGDGVAEQKPAANTATLDLNAEFLLKMPAQSQQAGSNITENTQTAVVGNTKDGRLSSLAAGIQNSEITPETKFQHETKNSQMQPLPAADRPSDQTANPKLAAEVALGKPVEEAFNLKGAAFKNQMPLAGQVIDKVIQIDGESKDSSLLHGQDQMSERLAKFETATSTSESTQRSLSSQAMNQIVQKAVLSFNNGQNEIRIDLKPEFLGHIRMHIVTDSHQVAVKIIAESPFVKDMLESNLNQLKADLQAQGLKVDELEVSVGHDSHSGTKNKTPAEASKSSALRDDTASDDGHSEEQIESQADGSESIAENAIDYFA